MGEEVRERGELLPRIVSLSSSLAERGCGRSGDKSSEREDDVGRLPKETTDERTGNRASLRCCFCNQEYLTKICSITHWPNFNLNRKDAAAVTWYLSLSGYFFVKDKTDIRDQNLLIVKTIYKECQKFSLGKM